MRKYILKRQMQYTERVEVETENWDGAVALLRDPDTDFERMEDDTLVDESIEYIGET